METEYTLVTKYNNRSIQFNKGLPKNLCLNAGYTRSTQSVKERKYAVHISPSEECKKIEHSPDFRARRWVAEVTYFQSLRKLLVRFEKKAQNYLALIHLASSIIAWCKLIQVHR